MTRHALSPSFHLLHHTQQRRGHTHTGERDGVTADDLFETAKELLLADFIEGSDPGICIAADREIGQEVSRFGFIAKREVVTQEEARTFARQAGILLEGLGGTEDGVIGALAGVCLAASGNDGRFVQKGTTRSLHGTSTVAAILASGVDRVMTRDGAAVSEGLVCLKKFPKPAFVGGEAILYVEGENGVYRDIVVG